MIETLPGHSRIKKLLTKLCVAPPPALLFQGSRGLGKARFAKAFAQDLLLERKDQSQSECVDLRQLYPEGKMWMHSIEAVKGLIKQVFLPPFQSRKKVFIIHEADRMLPYASNALLKTLEEPPTYAHLILLSSRPEDMLRTVLSRLLPITFFSLSQTALKVYVEKEWGKSAQEAQRIALLAHGNLKVAEDLAQGKEADFFPLVVQMGMAALQENYPLLFTYISELSLLIKEAYPKEVEKIFSAIYYWYRDLHLLKLGGNRSLLFFQKYEKQLETGAKFPLPDLVEVQKRVKQSIQLWEGMNITFPVCMNYLFIF